MIVNFLLVLFLIFSIAIVFEKNNLKVIIFFSLFSFIAASIYFVNMAFDIALAEIAVGCALIPFIYVITISKQKKFTVYFYNETFYHETIDTGYIVEEFEKLMEEFCNIYELKLNLVTRVEKYNPTIHGIFRAGNIDLIVTFNLEDKFLNVIGNRSNMMISKLERIIKNKGLIKLIRVDDNE